MGGNQEARNVSLSICLLKLPLLLDVALMLLWQLSSVMMNVLMRTVPLIKLLLLFGGINLHPIKFKKLYLQDLELPAPLVKYLEVGGLFLRSSGAAPMVHCAHVCMV